MVARLNLATLPLKAACFSKTTTSRLGEIVVEWITARKVTIVIGVRIGSNFTTNRGVRGHFSISLQLTHELYVDRGSHPDLGQVQSDIHIGFDQSQRTC